MSSSGAALFTPALADPSAVYRQFTFADRLRELQFAYSSPAAQDLFCDRCSWDPVYFINCVGDTSNPQIPGAVDRPMLLYFRQEELVRFYVYCIIRGLDHCTEKCRKGGISWINVYVRLWFWLFHTGYQSHWGSRTKELVDQKGNPHSLMWKFDYAFSRLPAFIKDRYAPGYSEDDQRLRTRYKIENPYTGGVITGEAVTPDFGAAARGLDAFVDEASKCQFLKDAYTACGQTVPCRSLVATPNGQDYFWELVHPDEAMARRKLRQVPRPRIVRFAWQDVEHFNHFKIYRRVKGNTHFRDREDVDRFMEENHDFLIASGNGWLPQGHHLPIAKGRGAYAPYHTIPLNRGYDEHGVITHEEKRRPLPELPEGAAYILYPDYEKESTRYDEVEQERELNIGYEGSVSGRVYADFLPLVKKETRIARNKDWPLYIWCDPGGTDFFTLIYSQWNWSRLGYDWLQEFYWTGKDVYFVLPLITGLRKHIREAEERGYYYSEEEKEVIALHASPIWRPDTLIIDPNGGTQRTANNQDSVSRVLALAEHEDGSAYMNVYLNHEHRDFNTRIPALKRILPRSAISQTGCPMCLSALSTVAKPPRSSATVAVTEPRGYAHHPLYSHFTAAAEYGACADPHRYDVPDAEVPLEEQSKSEEDLHERFPKGLKEKLGWDPNRRRQTRTRAGYT